MKDTTENVTHVEKKNIKNIIHDINNATTMLNGTIPIFNITLNDFHMPLKSAFPSSCAAFFSNAKNVFKLTNHVKIK